MGECKEIVLVVFVGLNMVLGGVGAGAARVAREVSSPPEAFSTGEHDLRAYACRKDVGEWVESNQSTVTFEGCTAGNKYVRADVVDYGMVDGIQGTIMTRYGDLCCEDKGGTAEAFQVAWVNIGTIAVGTAKWGQLGYGKQRNAGFTTTYKYRYWEVKRHDVAEPEDTYATDLAPDEGDEHVYKIRFERSTGTLKFYVDGSLWEEHPDDDDDYWTTNKNLHYAGWAGEILNEEDDMPGTESSRCDFTDCGYWKVGSGYTDAGFVEPDSYFSSDDSKWPWDHESTTSFNIYDKYPGE